MPRPTTKRARIIRFFRNIIISVLALLTLFIGAGVGYTWYMSRNVDNDTVFKDEAVIVAPEKVLTHTKTSDNVAQGVALQSITSPVLPGSNASITIRTNNDSKCTISVMYNEVVSTDSGLVDKPSDDYGMVTWSWTVGSDVPLGKWPVKVVCSRDSNHVANYIAELVVSDKLEP